VVHPERDDSIENLSEGIVSSSLFQLEGQTRAKPFIKNLLLISMHIQTVPGV
jgi:hypothetical protein